MISRASPRASAPSRATYDKIWLRTSVSSGTLHKALDPAVTARPGAGWREVYN